MAKVLAIVNQKGGVGKTAVTCQLAYTLARQGERVLVVDMDPQGNATSIMDIDTTDIPTVYDVLYAIANGQNVDATEAVVEAPEAWAGVHVLPADRNLGSIEGDVRNGREHRLRKALEDVKNAYDFVLIDCPPSIGACTANALTAADEAVIVTTADSESFAGITGIMQSIAEIREYTNSSLVISPLGIIVNKSQQQFVDQQAWFNTLNEAHGAIVNATQIPSRQIVNQARTNHVPTPSKEGRDIDEAFTKIAEELVRLNTNKGDE